MTDDIKVGDRFLVPVVVGKETAVPVPEGYRYYRIDVDGAELAWVKPHILSTCQRLPPEIGVGDEVRTRFTPGVVKAIDGEVAWLRSTISDKSYFSANLSDLSLVKKAEKD